MKILLALAVATLLAASPRLEGAVLTGPVTNAANGHLYYLLDSNSWTAAEAEAMTLGGHLVTINDMAENHWVYTNFITYDGVQRPLWIGLTDRRIDGCNPLFSSHVPQRNADNPYA